MTNKMQSVVESLLTAAAETDIPDYAMKFTQAALNAANAIRVLADTEVVLHQVSVLEKAESKLDQLT